MDVSLLRLQRTCESPFPPGVIDDGVMNWLEDLLLQDGGPETCGNSGWTAAQQMPALNTAHFNPAFAAQAVGVPPLPLAESSAVRVSSPDFQPAQLPVPDNTVTSRHSVGCWSGADNTATTQLQTAQQQREPMPGEKRKTRKSKKASFEEVRVLQCFCLYCPSGLTWAYA